MPSQIIILVLIEWNKTKLQFLKNDFNFETFTSTRVSLLLQNENVNTFAPSTRTLRCRNAHVFRYHPGLHFHICTWEAETEHALTSMKKRGEYPRYASSANI